MSRLFSFLAKTAPQPRQGLLLRKLLDAAQAIAGREVELFRFRLADALLKLSETTNVPAEEQASFHAHNHLRKQGDKLCAVFAAALNRHTSAALRALEDGRQDVPPLMPADLDSAEDRLRLDELAQSLEKQSADALVELNCSLAALLERDALPSEQNPWRAQVFLIALYQAWCELDAERASRRVVLGLLGPQLFLPLDAIYAGLNAVLAEGGITPDPKALVRARRSGTHAKPAAPTRKGEVEPGQTPAVRLHDERYYRVRDWLLGGSRAAPGQAQEDAHLNLPDLFAPPDTGGKLQANTISVAVTPRLFSHLTRLQQKQHKQEKMLRQIGRGLPPGVLTPLDETTLELVERVFDRLLNSPDVADCAKPLLLRLQIPVLKAALMDRKFFIDGANPAHRLLDQVIACCAGWEQLGSDSDPLRLGLNRLVERIATEFDQKVSMLAEASAEIEALLQDEQRQAESTVAASVGHALRAEKLYQAELAARADILERLECGAVPYSLENFLQTQWLSVLTLAHAASRRKPDLLPRALAVMDDLLWSLQARSDGADRRELLQRLPGILTRLNAWLDAIKWHGPERTAFFEGLAQQHAALVRSSRDDARAQLETALAQTRRASERSMLGARRKPAPGSLRPASPVDDLCHGDWFELQEEGCDPCCLRVAWISPQRSQFILASRRAARTLVLSELELDRRLQQGQARSLRVEGAVDRALDAVLAQAAPALHDAA